MGNKKNIKGSEKGGEKFNISEYMNTSFSPKIYATNGGLGYQEYAYLIKISETENDNSYLVIDITQGPFQTNDYEVGSIVEIENEYVEKVDSYKLEHSELYGNFLFHFFLKNNGL